MAQTDKRLMALVGRYQTHFDYDAAFADASSGKVILVEGETFLKYAIRSRLTNE